MSTATLLTCHHVPGLLLHLIGGLLQRAVHLRRGGSVLTVSPPSPGARPPISAPLTFSKSPARPEPSTSPSASSCCSTLGICGEELAVTGPRAHGLGGGGEQTPGPPSRPHRAVVGREGDAVRRDAGAGLPAALQGLPEALPQVAQPRAVVALQLLEAPLGAVDGAQSGRQRLQRWGGSEGSACPSSPCRAPNSQPSAPGRYLPKGSAGIPAPRPRCS